jgi:PAS domain S-box-containing protein
MSPLPKESPTLAEHPMPQAPSILIVEVESILALGLKQQLLDLRYGLPDIATSGAQATSLVAQRRPDLILMDLGLEGHPNGIEVAEAIRRIHDIPVIFLTSPGDDEVLVRAARAAPYGYLTEPYQSKDLRAGIEVALTKGRLERQLREADRWFARTLQCVADGVIFTDLDACVRFMNPAAEKLTGWTCDDAIGREVGEIVRILPRYHDGHPDDALPQRSHRYESTAMIRSVLQLGRPAPVAHALELVSRAGVASIVDEIVGPVDDDGDKRLGAVLVLRDVSVRVSQEEKLRNSEERFRSAFDNAPLGMALVALSGGILQVNGALCQMLGATAEALKQQDHANLIVETDRDHETQRLHELLTGVQPVVQYERRYRRPGGGDPVCTLVSVSLVHEGDQPSCYLFQVHDLTEQKIAAEQLAELAAERIKRQASEVESAGKSDLLSRVSHELRVPLNTVIGFATLLQLQSGGGNAKSETYVDNIRAAGEHLLAIVTDLLALNQYADASLRTVPQPVVLAAEVDKALQMLAGLSQAHGIELQSSIAPSLVALADPLRLRQVLLNVTSNAIKYNRQGGSVRFRADALATGRLRLTVEDTGIGMTPDQLDRLFRPFDRLGQERTETPGTGLGLVITQVLVNQLGGTLVVASKPRAGTTVTIELPAAMAMEASLDSRGRSALRRSSPTAVVAGGGVLPVAEEPV